MEPFAGMVQAAQGLPEVGQSFHGWAAGNSPPAYFSGKPGGQRKSVHQKLLKTPSCPKLKAYWNRRN